MHMCYVVRLLDCLVNVVSDYAQLPTVNIMQSLDFFLLFHILSRIHSLSFKNLKLGREIKALKIELNFHCHRYPRIFLF